MGVPITAVQGPIVARRRLRTALRGAREGAEFTQEQAADALDWSVSKLLRIEAGTVGVSTTDVKAMLQLFGVNDPDEIGEMVALARAARQRTWWAGYRDAIPPQFFSYIGLEAECSALYFFQPLLIPGLLQTEAYAESVIRETSPGELSPADREIRRDIRLKRQQEVLGRDEPPRIDVVLDESTLHRGIGGRGVMREQLLHLVALADAGHVTIQVLPFSAGLITVSGPFIILTFADGADSDVVYIESSLTNLVLDHRVGTGQHRAEFQRLQQTALTPSDSVAFIAKVAGELS